MNVSKMFKQNLKKSEQDMEGRHELCFESRKKSEKIGNIFI